MIGVFGKFLTGTRADIALAAHSFWLLGVDASEQEVRASKQNDFAALHAMGAFDVPTPGAVPFLNIAESSPEDVAYGFQLPGGEAFEEVEQGIEENQGTAYRKRALKSSLRSSHH